MRAAAAALLCALLCPLWTERPAGGGRGLSLCAPARGRWHIGVATYEQEDPAAAARGQAARRRRRRAAAAPQPPALQHRQPGGGRALHPWWTCLSGTGGSAGERHCVGSDHRRVSGSGPRHTAHPWRRPAQQPQPCSAKLCWAPCCALHSTTQAHTTGTPALGMSARCLSECL